MLPVLSYDPAMLSPNSLHKFESSLVKRKIIGGVHLDVHLSQALHIATLTPRTSTTTTTTNLHISFQPRIYSYIDVPHPETFSCV